MTTKSAGAQKPIRDPHDFSVVEHFGKKPLTGADPVLIKLIREAMKKT